MKNDFGKASKNTSITLVDCIIYMIIRPVNTYSRNKNKNQHISLVFSTSVVRIMSSYLYKILYLSLNFEFESVFSSHIFSAEF